MPIRGTPRGSFRGRGLPNRGRGIPPNRNFTGMMTTENSFEQMSITSTGPQHISDMDFTTDDYPVQMGGPNPNGSWDNSERKRPKPMEHDGPVKKPCFFGPAPGPQLQGFPPRPLLPRPMGPLPFGRPPRPPMPPMPDMGPGFGPRHFGPGPGFRGPPLPPVARGGGPPRFFPPPFSRPGPPMRPMNFRPPGPPRGFPNGLRAPGGRPGRGAFGGGSRMFRQ